MQNKPWRNEELKEGEEALSRLKEGDLEKTKKHCTRQKQEWDATDSTRKFPWRGDVVEFLEKVVQSGKWPQQACTTMFFLDTKECHE